MSKNPFKISTTNANIGKIKNIFFIKNLKNICNFRLLIIINNGQ